MKIKAVTVTYGRKINMGNYSSVNLEVTLSADMEREDDDNEGNCIAELFRVSREYAKAEYIRLKPTSPKPEGESHEV